MRKSIIVSLFFAVSMLYVVRVHAETAMVTEPFADVITSIATSTPSDTPTTTPQIETPTSTVPVLIQRIRDAKEMLHDETLKYAITPVYSKKKKIVGYSTYNQEIALAIYDPATEHISIIKGVQNKKKFVFNDPKVSVKAQGFNGVNTRFVVSKPAGAFVIALNYLITPTTAGSKKSLTSQIKQAIYVPYSDQLNTEEVYTYGNNYVDNAIRAASEQLKNRTSSLAPDRTVAEAVDSALIKALIYSEHMDETQLRKTDDAQSLVNKVNALFAANEDTTYNYSVSSASARGIAQFIPSTYKSLVARHPDAGLITDFVKGMDDHVNAIKAAHLLIDDYTASVKQGLKDLFDNEQAPFYGAAAYNGGVTRVVRAVKQFGNDWEEDASIEIANLNKQIASGKALVKKLKSQYAKAKTAADKKTINAKLKTAQADVAASTAQLSAMQKAALKRETVGYIAKIEKLYPLFVNK